MKHNPRLNEKLAGCQFCDVHPLQPQDTVQAPWRSSTSLRNG
jgi:glycine cleavage system protein P-like pyridoxal-binding family